VIRGVKLVIWEVTLHKMHIKTIQAVPVVYLADWTLRKWPKKTPLRQYLALVPSITVRIFSNSTVMYDSDM